MFREGFSRHEDDLLGMEKSF
ncbi:MAG: hypothetical protein JWM68_3234, partial [Verrucomicrobiales bacterium]|nr:hypothetical protein [Verrucomicrobiales bacterium]